MSLHTATDISRAAQLSWDNLSEDETGDLTSEAAADLARSLIHDPEACREAEQWTAGTFDGDHYTDVTLALHQLHHTDPADLLDSPLLAKLYELAAVEAAAIDEQLREQAVQQVAA
ncbi:hypothetical protein [uncultured Stenotrophomonas sp.]|uniref:hypothetical protein n=1 Tax=uncultured Stenotrophomonas sp. TaxID=165438 RepID=UPI0028EDDA44|nr:hypothetical protein [uncultured Stenotrophomonas sp.]